MCRNIKNLFNFDPPVTEEEIRAASVQFVRKICGFTRPSRANQAVFDAAIDEVSAVSARLLGSLESSAPPKNREEEAAKARAHGAAGRRTIAAMALFRRTPGCGSYGPGRPHPPRGIGRSWRSV